MARAKDIAGLAALGALGMMLNSKGGSEGKPSTPSDDQYNPDVKYAGLMEQKEPGWESGTSTKPKKPSSAGGSKPSSKRSEIVNPELTRIAGQGGPRGTRYNEDDASQTRIAGQGGPRGTRYNENAAPQRSLNSAEALAQLDQQTGVRAMDPNSSRGPNAADSTELGRNFSALSNATGPGKLVTGLSLAAREARAADLAQKAYNQRAALRRSEEGLNAEEAARAAVSARDAKTLNPMAWMAGPKGMKEDFKRGGKVKKMASGGKAKVSASSRGDGIAMRGKTRGKLY
jgi:hypothetical protein